ncbi:YabP/YqfC family sporulation protein [Paludicola sp. MB14-C6]|uniref:YabP/YqfC family sporulation protein n=1 Tax=Paludihabitans sp. MB14-C6 TaxID=3070656 RepID=UPI0027DDF1E7|nr:YabP/YqfC family sporulation protein [Paludicola sp. MB14-C6]WMJ23521.1 YabP/YqfC family sporulation protein [Paludicola sp. MB14-C6]
MAKRDGKNSLIKAFINVKEDIVAHSQIEIVGNKEAVIQGAKGIIEYTDELIRINLENLEVDFYGQKLTIESLSQDSLEIKGIIQRVEYL